MTRMSKREIKEFLVPGTFIAIQILVSQIITRINTQKYNG